MSASNPIFFHNLLYLETTGIAIDPLPFCLFSAIHSQSNALFTSSPAKKNHITKIAGFEL